jgi:cytochrome c-type biogenesis protein CcmH
MMKASATSFFSPSGRSAERCEAMRGLRHILRALCGFAPLIRRCAPPSRRWGEETRGGRWAKRLFVILLVLTPLPAFAVLPDEILNDPALEQRARDLSAQLRCMVCQNQSIDDSNAELARDLRVLVRERLTNGDSDEAVIDYVVSRYGEFVLLKPRISLRTLLLWGAPVLLLLIGATVMIVFVRKRAVMPQGQKLSADEEARIRDILDK